MKRFEWAIEHVLRHEGGYVFDPDDPGGETNFGISKRSYPDLNISKLTRNHAIDIYQRDYWKSWMDKINDPVLALQVFDFGVNAGLVRAAVLLQRSAGVRQDGIIGPVTLESVNSQDTMKMRVEFLVNTLKHYMRISLRWPRMAKYIDGWFRRAAENAVEAPGEDF